MGHIPTWTELLMQAISGLGGILAGVLYILWKDR